MKTLLSGAVLAVAAFVVGVGSAHAAWGDIVDYNKIGPLDGGFSGALVQGDTFGYKVDLAGDINQDGIDDLIVEAKGIDDGGENRGGLFVLFMNTNGTVASHTRVSDTSGSPITFELDDRDGFGSGDVAGIGDLNGDTVPDIAVGTLRDDDGGIDRGAVYILFMNTNGTFSTYHKISSTSGDLSTPLMDQDFFGSAVASLGDLDDDGVTDLAVASSHSSAVGFHEGAVYILFMNSNGTVKSSAVINDGTPNFAGALSQVGHLGSDVFGEAMDVIPDLDGDGNNELFVGAYLNDAVGANSGTAFVIFLDNLGGVKSYTELDFNSGVLANTIELTDYFGTAVASIGDLTNDGYPEVAVYSYNDDDAGTNEGAVYIFSLDSTGNAVDFVKFDQTHPVVAGATALGDEFGGSLSRLGDFNGDGCMDLLAGAAFDDDLALNTGSIYLLYLDCDTGASGALLAPVPGGNGALSAPVVTERTARLHWEAAVDNDTTEDQLMYRVWLSDSNDDLGTVELAEQQTLKGEVVGNTELELEDLIPGREYVVNVVVEDILGNKAAYEQLTFSTVDDGLPRGKVVAIGSNGRYYYIDTDGENAYRFRDELFAKTWFVYYGEVPQTTYREIRGLSNHRSIDLPPAPGVSIIKQGNTYYWIEGTFDNPVLRKFKDRNVLREVIGSGYSDYVIPASNSTVLDYTRGEDIDSETSLDLSRLTTKRDVVRYQ